MTNIQIFLSYASEDRELVDNLYNCLSEQGYKPWMDHRDILPGEQWEYKIKKALSQSHFFIACLTNNSVNKRGWIQKELKTARDNWQFKLDDDIYLIPVHLEKCPLPESVSTFQSVYYYEKDGWSKLLKALEAGAERLGISIERNVEPEGCAVRVEERLPCAFFQGRSQALRDLKRLTKDKSRRIISVCGPAGIGKTELSIAFKEAVCNSFRDGCYFVELDGIKSKDGLVLRINIKLGASDKADEQTLFQFVHDKNLLLILDNFEDPLTDRAKTLKFMQQLQRRSGLMQILLTTRETLKDASIERMYDLSPLEREDSKKLFNALACAQGCPERFTEKDLTALLDELGDLPLAIALSASNVHDYTLKGLIHSLRAQGIALLSIYGVNPDEAAKEQSLTKSLSLSWLKIQGTNEESLFYLASLFPSGILLQEAQTILPETDLPQFIGLCAKSLLKKRENNRYAMLAPIRAYGQDMLKKSQRYELITTRWLKVMTAGSKQFDEARFGKGEKDIAVLMEELPNYLTAMDYLLRKDVEEKDRLLDMTCNLWNFMRFRALYEEIHDYVTQVKETAQKAGDITGEAKTISYLGRTYLKESQNEEARQALEEAFELFEKVNDAKGQAYCLRFLGHIHKRESRIEDAKIAYEQAMTLYRKVGNLLGEAHCIKSLGHIHKRESRIEDAKIAYEQAMTLYRKVADLLGEANCIQGLGDIHLRESRHEEAKKAYEQAMALYRKVGDLLGEANCIKGFGQIFIKQGRFEEGLAEIEKAHRMYEQINGTYDIAESYDELGDLLAEQEGRKEEAKAAYDKAAELYELIKIPQLAQRCREKKERIL